MKYGEMAICSTGTIHSLILIFPICKVLTLTTSIYHQILSTTEFLLQVSAFLSRNFHF